MREPRNNWERLVQMCADGKEICNCSDAYCNKAGMCEYGCDANKSFCKEKIATTLFEKFLNKAAE